MSKYIGVDLGTANTLVYCKGKGIVLNEPSVVAVRVSNGAVLAVGEQAKQMIGKTPEEIAVIRPLSGGVIADFEIAHAMLKAFLEKACPGGFLKPYVTVCVPYGVTDVERRAVLEAVVRSGGKNAYVIEEPMAAALGADLAPLSAVGSMVADIGGGTCEVAVVSFGGTVSGTSIRYAGDKMDRDIGAYIKEHHGVFIGERTAERIKLAIGSACPVSEETETTVMGRDEMNGLPKMVTVTSEEVRQAMAPTVEKIICAIKATLENTPPELVTDIARQGIVLTGGGANIPGLPRLIREKTGIPAYVAENPEECVAKGAGIALTAASDKTAARTGKFFAGKAGA